MCRNTAEFSGHQLISNGQKDSGDMFCGQMSPRFGCYKEKTDIWFYGSFPGRSVVISAQQCPTSVRVLDTSVSH